jgi:hypothetical protein
LVTLAASCLDAASLGFFFTGMGVFYGLKIAAEMRGKFIFEEI